MGVQGKVAPLILHPHLQIPNARTTADLKKSSLNRPEPKNTFENQMSAQISYSPVNFERKIKFQLTRAKKATTLKIASKK